MNGLMSRKLAAAVAAMAGVVGLVLGLAVIEPGLLTDAKEVVGVAVIGIIGLGGYHMTKQAEVDRLEPWGQADKPSAPHQPPMGEPRG